MKRKLIIGLIASWGLLGLQFQAKAQAESYEEHRVNIQMMFDMALGINEEAVFIFGAMEDYSFRTAMKRDSSSLEKQLSEVIAAAECKDCELVLRKVTDSPLDFLFDNVQERDVYLITRYQKDYYVRMYRSPYTKEEEE